MPVNELEVLHEIRLLGYGTHSQYGAALALNIEGKVKSKHSGKYRRVAFGEPLSQMQKDQIMSRFDEGAEKAAARYIIDVVSGKVSAAQMLMQQTAGPPTVDVQGQIAQGITAGVKEALAALGLDAETVALLKAKAAVRRGTKPKVPKGPKPSQAASA